jgi:uncharacterized membrane protein YcaP (DUF421 family)
MWHDLFTFQIPVLEKVVRTVAVYLLILLIFRVIGKRSIGSLNTMDFVVMFLLSNVVQNAIIGNDNSLIGGAVGAGTLVLTNAIVDRLAFEFPAFRRLVEGTATQVVDDGKVDAAALRRLGMRQEELDHAIHLQDGDDVSEIGNGTLQPGGQLILTLKPGEQDADHNDIADLRKQLDRIEALLRRPAADPGPLGQ